MQRALGDYITGGVQGEVYNASDEYTEFLRRRTDGIFGDKFIVKVLDYREEGARSAYRDMIHKLNIYKTIRDHEIAHVIPLIHWMSYYDETHIIDQTDSEIEDIRKIPCGQLIMAFPELDGTVESICRRLTVDARKDICLQMVYIIKALHSVDITHEDFHLDNLMYSVKPDGSYYIHVIDFDLANSEKSFGQDYVRLCDNITVIMYSRSFHRCSEIKEYKALYHCMSETMNAARKTRYSKHSLEMLEDALIKTVFDPKTLYYDTQ